MLPTHATSDIWRSMENRFEVSARLEIGAKPNHLAEEFFVGALAYDITQTEIGL
jgi:hypothetical protein